MSDLEMNKVGGGGGMGHISEEQNRTLINENNLANKDTYQERIAASPNHSPTANLVRQRLGSPSDQVFGNDVGKPVSDQDTLSSATGYRKLKNGAVYVGHFHEGKPHTVSAFNQVTRLLPSWLPGGELLAKGLESAFGTPATIYYPDGSTAKADFSEGTPVRGSIADPDNNSWDGEIDTNAMPAGSGTFSWLDSQGKRQGTKLRLLENNMERSPADLFKQMTEQLREVAPENPKDLAEPKGPKKIQYSIDN